MKRIDQTDTQQKIESFLQLTGLKKYWLARKCDIPRKTFYDFCNNKRSIPRIQERRLIAFVDEYLRVNHDLLFHF